MKLVSWNVNSLKQRMPRVLELLDEHQPDIVCLQETKAPADAFPALELQAAGYSAVHHSGGRWAGVAILSRKEADGVVCGLQGETEPTECRWLEATIDGVTFVSVYVPNGRSVDSPAFVSKLAFLDAMAMRAAALPAGPRIIAGDMNIAPGDHDVYDPQAYIGSTHVTVQERHRLARILDTGLVDAYRHLDPDGQHFTWWDYRAGHFHKGLGMRIDLLLVSPDLAQRLTFCGIDRSYRKGAKPSDHAPLLAEFRD